MIDSPFRNAWAFAQTRSLHWGLSRPTDTNGADAIPLERADHQLPPSVLNRKLMVSQRDSLESHACVHRKCRCFGIAPPCTGCTFPRGIASYRSVAMNESYSSYSKVRKWTFRVPNTVAIRHVESFR